MRQSAALVTSLICCAFLLASPARAQAPDATLGCEGAICWRIENRFRLFKDRRDFDRHEAVWRDASPMTPEEIRDGARPRGRRGRRMGAGDGRPALLQRAAEHRAADLPTRRRDRGRAEAEGFPGRDLGRAGRGRRGLLHMDLPGRRRPQGRASGRRRLRHPRADRPRRRDRRARRPSAGRAARLGQPRRKAARHARRRPRRQLHLRRGQSGQAGAPRRKGRAGRVLQPRLSLGPVQPAARLRAESRRAARAPAEAGADLRSLARDDHRARLHV